MTAQICNIAQSFMRAQNIDSVRIRGRRQIDASAGLVLVGVEFTIKAMESGDKSA
jgi:hypothetical protein